MKTVIIRYSEIHLKGKNRGFFENALVTNLRHALAGFATIISKHSGRYYISGFAPEVEDEVVERARKVFGVHSLSVADETDSDIEKIAQKCIELTNGASGTFKVETNRADKSFPLTSMQVSAELGYRLLNANPALKVDIFTPALKIGVDIRENRKTLIYKDVIKGPGGMPVGTGGKGLVLLSGGIDSPVAAYMMAKRGMSLRALHFHSFPYTSRIAQDKVLQLAQILKTYTVNLAVDMISVTKIQTAIDEKCPKPYAITLLRRFMMRIAQKIAETKNVNALITGESLGQVASQTLESICCTNAVVTMPVLRPLIGFDKSEIIETARKIETFETSILPHEDCCTVFLPENPITRPSQKTVGEIERVLDIDALISEALQTIEHINL